MKTLNHIIKLFICVVLWTNQANAQLFVEQGRIVFERKTNLLKIKNLPPFMQKHADEAKTKVDNFELLFDGKQSAFLPIDQPNVTPSPIDFLTVKNKVYTTATTGERITGMDLMGTKVFLKDTAKTRGWIMTENTRDIAGYHCRMAINPVNDSTRLYAWYALELVPSVGPETFFGLPGAILGLATEDGGIVYFAKSVEIITPDPKKFDPAIGKTEVYSIPKFQEEMAKRIGNNPMVKDMMKGFFMWY